VIYNEDDFGKGADSSRSELESTEETVVEIPAESEEGNPAESEEEIDDPVSEGEVDDQPVLPRCSRQVSKPPVHYGIDNYTITVSILNNVAHQVD